jgi:hypothetical protein
VVRIRSTPILNLILWDSYEIVISYGQIPLIGIDENSEICVLCDVFLVERRFSFFRASVGCKNRESVKQKEIRRLPVSNCIVNLAHCTSPRPAKNMEWWYRATYGKRFHNQIKQVRSHDTLATPVLDQNLSKL